MTPLAPHVTAFFRSDCRSSAAPVLATDRTPTRSLLEYASERLHVPPSAYTSSRSMPPGRRVPESSRSHSRQSPEFQKRPPGRHQVVHALPEFREPAAIDHIRRILAIPPKKADTRLVRHLTVEEMHAIWMRPSPPAGTAYAIGRCSTSASPRVARVRALGLQLRDVTLQPQATVLVHGKGRRERCLPSGKSPPPRCAPGSACGAPCPRPRSSSAPRPAADALRF